MNFFPPGFICIKVLFSISKKNWKVLIFLCAFPNLSFAYIDPGSGILLWQGLIAAVGAFLMAISHPIQFIKAQFRKLKNALKRDERNSE